MRDMSYHQLIDKMLLGVSTKEYRLAEDALSVIQDVYGSDHYTSALDKFSGMLRATSSNEKRESMVSQALKSGDLIITSTSIEPYCPKLGLTLRNVDFDSKGRPVPRGRANRNDNLKDSGASISTSKIILS
jgi:hypothetical protein